MPARKAAEQYNVINKCAAQSRVENADDMLSMLAGANVGMALSMTLSQRIPIGPRGSA